MTVQELSNEFDTRIAAYVNLHKFEENESLDSLEFDDYEKSVFLTMAQEEYVLGLYNGKNRYGEGFENTEELRRYLAPLIKETYPVLTPITGVSNVPLGISSNSRFFTLPEDLWFITYEAVTISNAGKCNDGATLQVVPVTQDEYHRVKDNPFRGPNKRRALRLDLSDGVVEVVCIYDVTGYYVRYLRKLSPIILIDLPKGLSIREVSAATECVFPDTVQDSILNLAVEIATRSKSGGKTAAS